MLETLSQVGRASGSLIMAPLRMLRFVADNSGRELVRVVSNGPLRGVVTEGPSRRGGDSHLRDDIDLRDNGADVLLDVPVVKVDKIELEVEDLEARVSLQAELADLVKLNVGADVRLGKVALDIEGVEAQALLKVRLDQVTAILDRALTTVDNNPQILEKLAETAQTAASEVGGTTQQALGKGGAASQAIDRVGETAEEAVGEGGAVGEAAGQAVQGASQGVGRAAESAGDAGEGAGQAAGAAGPAARRAGGAAQESAGDGDQPQATDAARRRARESGIDLGSLEGTGSGGTITVTDVRRAAEEG